MGCRIGIWAGLLAGLVLAQPLPQSRVVAGVKVSYSLGAGPQLIRAGRVVLDSTGEGFDQYNITHGKATRSVVATTARGEVILAILPGATLSETARALLALGATEAMNLDGGASSGVYCGGKYIVGPGRQVANGLALKQR